MADDITPALSAEEWARWNDWEGAEPRTPFVPFPESQPGTREQGVRRYADGIGVVSHDEDPEPEATVDGRDRHMLAALALYGQPFGFTRDDLRWLGGVRDLVKVGNMPRDAAALTYIIARIAALLPPEP
jgi:hypothetical protein